MIDTQSRQRAKPATPARYVWRKPQSRHLWFRYAVPTRYRQVEPRRIIQQSLATSDTRQASLLAGRKRAELHEWWESMLPNDERRLSEAQQTPFKPTVFDLQIAAAQAAYSEMMGKLDAYRRRRGITSNEGWERYADSIKQARLRLVRTRETDARALWVGVADRVIAAEGWSLSPDEPAYEEFIGMISEAGIEALRIHYERTGGNLGAAPVSQVVVGGLDAKERFAAPGETILELFDRYAAQRKAEKQKRADTLAQDRKVIALLAEFVGPKRSLRSITRAEVRDWRNTLALVPPNAGKTKTYVGLSLRDIAAKAQRDGVKGLSPTTINKHLSTLSPLCAWAIRNDYLETNPCEGLFYDLKKGQNPRPPFTTDQLNTILQSPLFVGFKRDGKESVPGECRADDWRFWIPLICLFTGARIGEVGQLRVDDIAREQGKWFFHIRNDEATGQTTKSGHSRPAALHSKLEAMGFLEFVFRQGERAEQDGDRRLFPGLPLNDRGQSGKASRFWRDYLSRIGVKQGGDGFGAHSFRHSLADQLRMAGYLDDQIEVALGHNQKTVTSGYGRLKQGTVTMLSAMIEAVEFEGVDFSHLTR